MAHASKSVGTKNAAIPTPTNYIVLPPNYYSPNLIPHHVMHHDSPNSSYNQNVPSLYDFLCSLDEEHNEEGVFKSLEAAFQEERIQVKHIKDLTDSQLVQLGVVKIGWQIALKQASKRYS